MVEIPPGGRAFIEVTYNSKADPVLKPGKRLIKSVEVWTNDPNRKMTILVLKGSVVQDPAKPKAYFPETTYFFGTVKAGTVVKHAFELQNRGDAPLKILQLTPS